MRRIALVMVAVLLGSGCSQISAQLGDEKVDGAVPAETAPPQALATDDWAVVDGMVSVVVRNDTRRALRYARARLVARDADGNPVGTSASSPQERCCTVVDLPPGARYGLYFDLADPAARVDHVEVSFADVAWTTATGRSTTSFRGRPGPIQDRSSEAVVPVDVTTRGAAVPEVVAQAFLTDERGALLAVVSGRWTCFTPGTRRIRMQLFHAVPRGTRVSDVMIRPVVHDPAGAGVSCDEPSAGS